MSAKFAASLDYVELAARDIVAAKAFFAAAFGWKATDYAPVYSSIAAGASEIGLWSAPDAAAEPLLLIRTDDVDAALAAVEAAGGALTRAIQPYPGGRRFHFRDPSGAQFGVYQPDA